MVDAEERVVRIRMSQEEADKLERMRRGSGRKSIQNVVEVLVALADDSAPEWNIIPQELANVAASPNPSAAN